MTVKITTERTYIDRPDFCAYINSEGKFVYQDMFGHKAYKTLKALNRKVAKDCSMFGVEVIEFAE